MKKAIVSLLLLLMLSVIAIQNVDAEAFQLTVGTPEFRTQHGITLSFPTLNGSVWGSKDSLDNSIYHWALEDGENAKKDMFFHMLVWKQPSTDISSFPSNTKMLFEKLLRKTYPNKKWGGFTADAPDSRTIKEKYSVQRLEVSVHELIEEQVPGDEGEEPTTETKEGPQFIGWGWSVVDPTHEVQFTFLATGKTGPFQSTSSIYSGVVNSFYYGKDSNAMLITFLLIGIFALIGIMGGYFYVEKKKKAERRNRLSRIQDDYYDDDYDDDYDDGYDDYDDYNAPRSRGRASSRGGGRVSSRSGGGRSSRDRAPRRRR